MGYGKHGILNLLKYDSSRKKGLTLLKKNILSLIIIGLGFMGGPATAVEPYDNIAGPDGTYLLLYPAYYAADDFMDSKGDTAITDFRLRSYSNVFRLSYAKTTERGKNNWLTTILVPISDVHIKNERAQGLGDVTLGYAYWVINRPETKTWLVLAGFADAPTGQFDANRIANVGSNVWKVRPTVGFAQQFNKFDVELTYRYNIYFKNDANGLKNGNESILESYFGYSVRPNLMIGIHANMIDGRNHSVNQIKVANSGVEKYQVGASANWVYGKTSGVTFEWLSEISTKNAPEGGVFLMRLFWKL